MRKSFTFKRMLPLQRQPNGRIGTRSVVTSLALLFAFSLFAQPDGLAKDFEKLSAKERARIAKEEQESAANDVAYQAVMTEAESLFQKAEYDASLEKFKEARTMRPYNVYPKVKIQDLQALIAKRDAEAQEKVVPPASDPLLERVQTTPLQVEGLAEEAITSPLLEPVVEPIVLPVVAPVVAPKVAVAPVPEKVEQKRTVPVRAAKLPEKAKVRSGSTESELVGAEGERVYKEGRSVVVENLIREDARLVVYRKVSHPWGAIDHFREGVAISDRAYQQAVEQ